MISHASDESFFVDDMVVDQDCNIYIAGRSPSVRPIVNWISKLDSNGDEVWTTHLTEGNVKSLEIDEGVLYLTGLILPGGSISGVEVGASARVPVLAALDADSGDHNWHFVPDSLGGDGWSVDLALDGAGQIHMSIVTCGVLRYGDREIGDNHDENDYYVATFDKSGTFLRLDLESGGTLATDDAGNLYSLTLPLR